MNSEVEILLVEDNPLDIELTITALRAAKLSNEIHVARDGQVALDFVFCDGIYAQRSFATPPKVILLDLTLPKIDGLDVLRTIRNDDRTKMIPVVILTSSGEQKNMVEGYKLGVNAYIQKPVEFDKFSEVIHHIGMFWMVVNRPPPAELFPS